MIVVFDSLKMLVTGDPLDEIDTALADAAVRRRLACAEQSTLAKESIIV